MAVNSSTVICPGPAIPLKEIWQLVMDSLYHNSSPEDHCYRNYPKYRNWHGTEQIHAALTPSATNSLTRLCVDCPPFPPRSRPVGGRTNRDGLLEANLAYCPNLHNLCIAITHPPTHCIMCRCVPDAFAAPLASWAPTDSKAGARTLTIAPAFEWNFTREQFVDVLREVTPAPEGALLAREGVKLVVCVNLNDRTEKREWWAETRRVASESGWRSGRGTWCGRECVRGRSRRFPALFSK